MHTLQVSEHMSARLLGTYGRTVCQTACDTSSPTTLPYSSLDSPRPATLQISWATSARNTKQGIKTSTCLFHIGTSSGFEVRISGIKIVILSHSKCKFYLGELEFSTELFSHLFIRRERWEDSKAINLASSKLVFQIKHNIKSIRVSTVRLASGNLPHPSSLPSLQGSRSYGRMHTTYCHNSPQSPSTRENEGRSYAETKQTKGLSQYFTIVGTTFKLLIIAPFHRTQHSSHS